MKTELRIKTKRLGDYTFIEATRLSDGLKMVIPQRAFSTNNFRHGHGPANKGTYAEGFAAGHVAGLQDCPYTGCGAGDCQEYFEAGYQEGFQVGKGEAEAHVPVDGIGRF